MASSLSLKDLMKASKQNFHCFAPTLHSLYQLISFCNILLIIILLIPYYSVPVVWLELQWETPQIGVDADGNIQKFLKVYEWFWASFHIYQLSFLIWTLLLNWTSQSCELANATLDKSPQPCKTRLLHISVTVLGFVTVANGLLRGPISDMQPSTLNLPNCLQNLHYLRTQHGPKRLAWVTMLKYWKADQEMFNYMSGGRWCNRMMYQGLESLVVQLRYVHRYRYTSIYSICH